MKRVEKAGAGPDGEESTKGFRLVPEYWPRPDRKEDDRKEDDRKEDDRKEDDRKEDDRKDNARAPAQTVVRRDAEA